MKQATLSHSAVWRSYVTEFVVADRNIFLANRIITNLPRETPYYKSARVSQTRKQLLVAIRCYPAGHRQLYLLNQLHYSTTHHYPYHRTHIPSNHHGYRMPLLPWRF